MAFSFCQCEIWSILNVHILKFRTSFTFTVKFRYLTFYCLHSVVICFSTVKFCQSWMFIYYFYTNSTFYCQNSIVICYSFTVKFCQSWVYISWNFAFLLTPTVKFQNLNFYYQNLVSICFFFTVKFCQCESCWYSKTSHFFYLYCVISKFFV